MSPPGPETALVRPRSSPARARASVADGRLLLALQALLVAVQVAWFTLIGWVGAVATLLPLALAGGPVGRRASRHPLPLHALPEPAAEER